MSFFFYKDAYYNGKLDINIDGIEFNKKIQFRKPWHQVESIKNDSPVYLICHFDNGIKFVPHLNKVVPNYSNYCVKPYSKHHIIPSNNTELHAITISDTEPLNCQNDDLLRQLTESRRIQLTNYMKKLSRDYLEFNKGHLLLFSQILFDELVHIIKDSNVFKQEFQLGTNVRSFLNLTNKYFVLTNYRPEDEPAQINDIVLETYDIYIPPQIKLPDLTNFYDSYLMRYIYQFSEDSFKSRKRIYDEYLKSKGLRITEVTDKIKPIAPIKPLQPIEPIKQSDENFPEQKKKQSTDTLPWYSIITIIIFIILILLCIVYRESLRSWSNLVNFDPRKFRDTLNPF